MKHLKSGHVVWGDFMFDDLDLWHSIDSRRRQKFGSDNPQCIVGNMY